VPWQAVSFETVRNLQSCLDPTDRCLASHMASDSCHWSNAVSIYARSDSRCRPREVEASSRSLHLQRLEHGIGRVGVEAGLELGE